MKRPVFLAGSIAALLVLSVIRSQADTTISSPTTSTQTINSGTLTVTSAGALNINSSNPAVTIGASGAVTINNSGTISQAGSGRGLDSNTASSNITVNNSGTITVTASGGSDAFRVNKDSAVSLTNTGTISVTNGNGGQALDWAAIATKSNFLDNQASGQILDNFEDAVRPGVNGVIMNEGTIKATPTSVAAPSGSDGIDTGSNVGVQVTNSGLIMGRHGITGGGATQSTYSITVNNLAGGTLAAFNGSGINIDGVFAGVTANVTNAFGGTIKGGVMSVATAGDGDGIDIDGVLTLNNSGDVLALGAKGNGDDGFTNTADGLAIGGGTITNNATGRIIGSTTAADAPNGDPTHTGNGILVDDSSNGPAVAATSITNSGLIQGKGGFGIRIVGTAFHNTIANNAGGKIQGGNTTDAAITTDNNTAITNSGAIVGDGGKAINMKGSGNSLTILGGAASITGDVSGGTSGTNTLTITPGAGNLFTYAGSFSGFSSANIGTGTTRLSGVSGSLGSIKLTGRLELLGANLLSSSSGLDLSAGYLKITAGGANGQTFASLTLEDNSTLDLDNSTSLTFNALTSAAAGKGLSVLNYDASDSPQYAVRFLGDLTSNSSFQGLASDSTIDGFGVQYTFDGTYTDLTAVPEASTLICGLALVGFLGIRRMRSLRMAEAV